MLSEINFEHSTAPSGLSLFSWRP